MTMYFMHTVLRLLLIRLLASSHRLLILFPRTACFTRSFCFLFAHSPALQNRLLSINHHVDFILTHSLARFAQIAPLISCASLMRFTHALCSSHALRSCASLMRSTHALRACAPLMRFAHALHSCAPLTRSTHALRSRAPLTHFARAFHSRALLRSFVRSLINSPTRIPKPNRTPHAFRGQLAHSFQNPWEKNLLHPLHTTSAHCAGSSCGKR